MSRRGPRSPNGMGQGNQIGIEFNLDNPTERRAFEVAQRMAMPHGRRKHMLVAIFNAIGDLENQLGQEVSADMITGMLLAIGAGARPALQRPVLNITDDDDGIRIVAGSAQKATATEQSNKALKKRRLLDF